MNAANLLLVAGSCLVSALATRGVLAYARGRLLDLPNERSSHVVPTPRGGGLGLVIGIVVVWMAASALGAGVSAQAAVVCAAICVIAGVGWWDDHSGLSSRVRLGLQLVAGAIIAWTITVPAEFAFAGWRFAGLPAMALVVAAVGSAWLINLTNFMDGIDGIAGTQGAVAALTAAVLLTGAGADPAWIGLALATMGACLGFLVWNWPPARIFMGDVGSTTLGLVLAVLLLAEVRAGIAIDLAFLPLAPFILDATSTLVRRIRRRERLSDAHRSHLYQRLARLWGSHRLVTLTYGGLALLGGLGAIAAQRNWLPAWLPDLVVVGAFLALSLYGRRRCPA